MPESRISTALQTASQGLVIGAALVYLFGFLIVSIFDAGYGIADFSLFRAKVLAVGTLFVFLTTLPVIAIFRMFGLFGLTIQHADVLAPNVTAKSQGWHDFDLLLYVPFVSTGISWLLAFLFTTNIGLAWKARGFGLYILILTVIALVGVWKHKKFDKYPLVFVSISFVASINLIIILFKYADRGFFWLTIWLSLAAGFTFQMSLTMSKVQNLKSLQWERMILGIAPIIFGIYAFKVYPRIGHQFGGGAPVPIVLHLTKKLPVFESESVQVSLIDETEQGFYVLRGSDKAVFVARGLVEEVEFLQAQSAR